MPQGRPGVRPDAGTAEFGPRLWRGGGGERPLGRYPGAAPWARAASGPGRAAAETPNLQSFVTFPWSDSSNGSFTVEGPEAGIYNAARGLDPR